MERGTLSPQRAAIAVCRSAAQSCLTLWDPMACSTPGFPVLHLPEFFPITPRHIHSWVSLPLWLSRFILSGAASSCLLLFPSSILDTSDLEGSSSCVVSFCLIMPFMRSHSQNTGGFAIPSSSGPHYSAPLRGSGCSQDPAHWQPAVSDPLLVVLLHRSGSRPLTTSGGETTARGDQTTAAWWSWAGEGVRADPAVSLRPSSSPDSPMSQGCLAPPCVGAGTCVLVAVLPLISSYVFFRLMFEELVGSFHLPRTSFIWTCGKRK